ncbi:uncharacterized protein LOC127080661 [Lathyrus oleraceus]|uniref:uncharacterized protein LOC127080661 n=1 Tax=Pisum sativum TaxID=3888 RepID=UPI0021D3B329|nr:uncharacterized protein LOC127080661 [Pisum sativum]
MKGDMITDTLANGSVATLLVCLNYTLSIYGKDFGVDLICLSLSQIDVILGMNWLELNHVYVNCFDKILMFPELEDSEDSRFISANQVEMSLKQDAQVLMMFASLKVESEAEISNLSVVCGFLDIFPNDIGDFPPDCSSSQWI